MDTNQAKAALLDEYMRTGDLGKLVMAYTALNAKAKENANAKEHANAVDEINVTYFGV